MSPVTREKRILETLVTLADTLVDDFDVASLFDDLVQRCTTVIDAADVGIVLGDSHGELMMMAASSPRLLSAEEIQLSKNSGPCIDAIHSGQVIRAGSLDEIAQRWPAFATVMRGSGYHSLHTVPLRLRSTVLGAMNFFRDSDGELGNSDAQVAHAIADIAAIGLMQERSVRESAIARKQLEHALASRIVVEQAKGIVSNSYDVTMEVAWALLRQRARSHQARVTDVARGVINGAIKI
ncbi:GAF and ANTAR domain-containing protein [Rathayibacter toxicus]|uniref:ANTAR domain-containing protein n=1 Tax=Rathayibacter toxicus TaxID=145458 RepID=A0A2S5Y4N3_9MICO|nr:GAF and ANTAR domain-containing protein [Rathayibacter toxicus]PPH20991.1 ANTAR domain-containing protein [Rathayibacter toxicus]PPH56355.1 ANTAR domain-containing protein [Rathayibacter toxicus]PPH58451.1 ANTAR domain-containing protein [Rathayibacter toxicus]PPH86196.1 ANTAR domain-containing protein [Rathayibacter toxicus]PPI13529.1 ANTAR domain-containing protein [Rathayibacter toxicus]